MARAENGGVSLRYRADGEGETVVFVPDLGCGGWLWAWQAPALAGPFEAVVYDPRGTGESDAPGGLYDATTLAADLEAVLADVGARRAHLVGAGLGGMVALEHTLVHDRAASLALLGSAARGAAMETDPLTAGPERLEGLLSEAFRAEHPEDVERIVAWRREEDATGDAVDAHAAAVEGFDAAGRLHEVTVPALVAHGGADTVVPAAAGEALAEGLPRGEFDRFESDPHWFFVEQARLATDRLAGFLSGA